MKPYSGREKGEHANNVSNLFDTLKDTCDKSNSNGSCQKWGAKCHFTTLNSVLAPLNSVSAPMVGAKMGCHFNN